MMETDDKLRERLVYVAADGEWLTRMIRNATGSQLDEIAGYYNLRRRWT